MRTIVMFGLFAVTTAPASAQSASAPYPLMAPIEQYRMPAAAEITLARSAAPAAIAAAAAVLVLGDSAYQTAVKGTNGFVCLVERSWANDFGNLDFWNPKVRGPVCYNPAAARSVLPAYLTRTRWVLAGESVTKMKAANGVSTPDLGAMAYMLSKDGYLGDNVKGPWHPHLMFLLPQTPAAAWGADVKQSTVLLLTAQGGAVSIFLVPVPRWSDGSQDTASP